MREARIGSSREGLHVLRLGELLTELLNEGHSPVEGIMARYFDVAYRQRTDGVWADRAEVAAHFSYLGEVVGHARVVVLEEVRDGRIYAERHTVDLAMRDGGEVTQEVYAFGQTGADGRFTRIEEVTLMLSGSGAHRTIGSAR